MQRNEMSGEIIPGGAFDDYDRANVGNSTECTSFIPGLPDDLAWSIVLRVPRCHIQALRKVNKQWRAAVASESFFQGRRQMGLTEPWLYASISDWQGSNSWFAYDPQCDTWHRVPPIPGSEHRNVLTLQFAALKGKLLVSGMVDRENPLAGANRVFLYDPRTNLWEKAASINTGRWFCMSGIVGGRLYVAGGIGTCNNLALVQSVEMYDAEEDKWQKVESGTRAELMTLPGYQAVLDGKLYAKNIGWGPRLGIAYDPLKGTLQELSHCMVEGWQGPTAALGGKLYIVDFGDNFRLKMWDQGCDKWRPVGDIKLPAGPYKPWAVQLVAFMGCLCLLLPDLSLRMVKMEGAHGDTTSCAKVQEVKGPAFGAPGEQVISTAAVLGCQVLEA